MPALYAETPPASSVPREALMIRKSKIETDNLPGRQFSDRGVCGKMHAVRNIEECRGCGREDSDD